MSWIRSVSLLLCSLPCVSLACGSSSNDDLFGGAGTQSTAGSSAAGSSQTEGGSSANAGRGGTAKGGSGGKSSGSGGTSNTGGISATGGGAGTTAGSSTEGGAPQAGTGGESTAGTTQTAGSAGEAGSSNTPSCDELRQDAEQALNEARECQPDEADQCKDRVKDLCNCEVRIARASTDDTADYLRAKKRFDDAGCKLVCVACLNVGEAKCSSSGSGPPRCARGL